MKNMQMEVGKTFWLFLLHPFTMKSIVTQSHYVTDILVHDKIILITVLNSEINSKQIIIVLLTLSRVEK